MMYLIIFINKKMLNWSIHTKEFSMFRGTSAGGKLPVEENFKFFH